MSIGLRAMAASYAAMTTTGHNIANANVPGYSRQQAELATSKGQFTGAGFFGKGVDVTTVSRAHDDFLTRAAATAKSLSAMDAARQDRLTQLETVFPTGEAGLGYTVSTFLNSMSDLASRPSDSATRQTVLANAQNVASQFNSASNQLDTIQAGVTSDLKTSVSTVNGLATSIAQVNQQIAALHGLGQPPNDLLDQRDQLINQLSAQVQVSTVPADDGTVGVFISGGQRLVLGNQASQLQVTLDPDDPSRSAVSLNDGGTLRALDPSSIGGGSIAGLLRFQNDDLVQGRNLIGQLAASVGAAVNQQQMMGVSLQEPIGSVASKPMFAIGAPVALPSSSNAKDASGNYASSVTLTVTDASALQAANYELRADPSGASGVYQLTRMSNPPLVQSIQSGDVVDGMRIDIGSPEPTATDRFLLKPVGQAAAGMQALLQDPRDLAAASPLTATASTTNTGTAVISALTMNTVPPQPAATAQINFTSDAGDYSWQLVDAGNNVLSSGTGTWQAGQAIPTPPNDINGFSLNLAGVPRNGDSLAVAPTPAAYVATNNGNALAMASLRDATVVGKTMLANGSTSGGSTATDAYASALADIGVRVQTANTVANTSAAMSAQADSAATSVSGVNLDEEAARLIQFQQSYQAAAKVLQIAQSIFQTLLQVTSS
jgi:flagellar hook-associated protein 1 FlgK